MLASQGGFSEATGMKMLSEASAKPEIIKEHDVEAAGGFYSNFVKMTDFDTEPENSFYREREWRCIGNFDFDLTDIEAVVAPKDYLNHISTKLSSLAIDQVSLISWELIENS